MMGYSGLVHRDSIASVTLVDPRQRSVDSKPAPLRRQDPLREIAEEAAFGSEEALHTLLLKVGAPMLHAVRKVLGADHPNVDDVAQEAALGLISSLAAFRGESTVTHFAARIALRTALHARRHFGVRRRIGDFSETEVEVLDEASNSPLEELISRERRRLLRGVLDQLSAPIAEALALHFMLGMTVSEIASAEGVSTNTIWSRLRLGKQSLRTVLEEDDALNALFKRGAS
jgi:RNA polymerase sigma factor (sigma-70 family)